MVAEFHPTSGSQGAKSFPLRPVAVPPAHQVVVDHLRRIIHLGEVQPGAKLPPERELSAQLGVSRTTLREALHILQVEGYVDIKLGQHGGVFVRTTTFPNEQLIQQWVTGPNDFRHIYELRASVEGFAAKTAARLIAPSALATLNETIASMESANSIGSFRQEDLRFHLSIAESTGLDLLLDTVERLRAALFIPFQLFDLAKMRSSTVREHRQILDALQARDPQTAGAFMIAHITRSAWAANSAIEDLRRG